MANGSRIPLRGQDTVTMRSSRPSSPKLAAGGAGTAAAAVRAASSAELWIAPLFLAVLFRAARLRAPPCWRA